MMRGILLILFFSVSLKGLGQPGFRTVVSKETIVAGDAFQVQFIIEDHSVETLRPPSFTSFRLVAGPAFYKGIIESAEGSRSLTNAVYTLEALKPGRYVIQGATLKIGGKLIRSNPVEVLVLSASEATARKEPVSEYFLRPGEDPGEKIRQNLFVKVFVDRRSCYVGEPVQATFKLYSRLQSRSDIIKNPGFYGFTVYDQVNLADKVSTVENIGGRLFDVHTIRKVQLFPLQSGELVIDEMELRNRVEFSRSAVSKKTEQEIVEGMSVFDDANEQLTEGSEFFESTIRTEPVSITVKPLPSPGRPSHFRGAVGNFEIKSDVLPASQSNGYKGEVVITIRGEGNLMQIDAPELAWPRGMEVFEPRTRDAFERDSYPLRGERSFRFPFVVTGNREFVLPALSFSFFNPDSGTFRSVSTQPQVFRASSSLVEPSEKTVVTKGSPKGFFWLIAVAVGLLTGGFVLWRKRKRNSDLKPRSESSQSDWLSLSELSMDGPEKTFYSALLGAFWNFLEKNYRVASFRTNKSAMLTSLAEKGVPAETCRELEEILDVCEAGSFTGARLELDKRELLDRSRRILEKLESHSEYL